MLERYNRFLKSTITFGTAAKVILIVCSFVVVFHILILLKIIPYDIVRGGRLTSDAEMIKFESISLLINILILLLVAMKSGYISYFIPKKVVSILIWGLVFLLIGNTIANIFSETLFEAIFFTILTGILTVLLYRLQIE